MEKLNTMHLPRRRSLKILVLATPILGFSIVWAQVDQALNPSDEFKAENQDRVKERKAIIEETRQVEKELGEPPAKAILVPDDEPGATGLKLRLATQAPISSSQVFNSLTYSELQGPIINDNPPVSKVVSPNYSLKTLLLNSFANYLPTDYGFVSDPLWMGAGRILVMKAGRYSDYDAYSLYAFDKSAPRLYRVTPARLKNQLISVSPTRRYMTYIVGGSLFGPDEMFGGSDPLELWAWDAQENKNYKIATDDWLQGSYSWISKDELVYSQAEKHQKRQVPVSYIWNAGTRQSKLMRENCQAPVISPDGKHIVYAKTANESKGFTEDNSVYCVQDTTNQAAQNVPRLGLGQYNIVRQILWSADSRLIFSVLNVSTEKGHRIFLYGSTTTKAKSWPVVKFGDEVRLLTSSSLGKRLFFIRKHMISEKTNALGEFDYLYTVESLNTNTGKLTVLVAKDRILGLSENGIVFNPQFLKD